MTVKPLWDNKHTIIMEVTTLTNEERREYLREWRRNNPDKVKAQRERRQRRLAVAALERVERLSDDVCVVKTTGGREFTMIRERVQA